MQYRNDKTLQFRCKAANLGKNMTSTIATAITALGEEHVTRHGYLLLNVESLPSVD